MDHNNVANIDQEAVVNCLNDAGSNFISIQDAQVDAEGAKLTDQERLALGRYEAVISKGRETYLEVGRALNAIHDGYLYREHYSSFDEYCLKKWNFTRAHGNTLMDAAESYEALSTMVDIGLPMPTSERQLRELAGVPTEVKAKVYKAAVEKSGGKVPTAKVIMQEAAAFKKPSAAKKKPDVKVKPADESSVVQEKRNAEVEGVSDNDQAIEHMETALTYLRGRTPGSLNASQKCTWKRMLNQVKLELKRL